MVLFNSNNISRKVLDLNEGKYDAIVISNSVTVAVLEKGIHNRDRIDRIFEVSYEFYRTPMNNLILAY